MYLVFCLLGFRVHLKNIALIAGGVVFALEFLQLLLHLRLIKCDSQQVRIDRLVGHLLLFFVELICGRVIYHLLDRCRGRVLLEELRLETLHLVMLLVKFVDLRLSLDRVCLLLVILLLLVVLLAIVWVNLKV